jgi:raffinose/stachyose/melibiose transport system substrate-binding protein
MNPFKRLLFCAFLGALPAAASSETVIKILHINPQPDVRAIWQEAAQQYESAQRSVKVQFDYLENEAFKAKLPTLLQSKDRPREMVPAPLPQPVHDAHSRKGRC